MPKVYVITVEDYDSCGECGQPAVHKVVSSKKKVVEWTAKLQKKNPGLHYDWEPFEVE